MKQNYLTSLLIIPLLLAGIPLCSAEEQSPSAKNTVVRAAIDIGSGATKLRVAEVDLSKKYIVNTLASKGFKVSYQESLMQAEDGNFHPEVMSEGLSAIREAVAIAQQHGAEKITAVATEAFRKAANAQQFIDEIHRQTGVKIEVIDQEKEGTLAFHAVRSEVGVPAEQLLVWDIGGGSLQLTMQDHRDDYKIYRGHDASTPFKNFVIEKLQGRKVEHFNTPNPLSTHEMTQAERHARQLARKVDRHFKDKVSHPKTVVVGVGNIFGYGISTLGEDPREITQAELKVAVAKLADKSDHELGGGDFADVFVTNALLVLGFMQELDIDRMLLTNVNAADASLFW
jgi:exopolyphosphatase/guanosine-5'-triphosphate,3'-diphosphate pyrophosphatase